MNAETQCDQILRYMRMHGSITRLKALQVAGSMNLPGRIYDLRRQGHRITDVWVSNKSKRFKAYSLAKGRERASA